MSGVSIEEHEEVLDKYRESINSYIALNSNYTELAGKYMELWNNYIGRVQYLWHVNYALWAYVTKYGDTLNIPKYLLETDGDQKIQVTVSENAGNLEFTTEVGFVDENISDNSDTQ